MSNGTHYGGTSQNTQTRKLEKFVPKIGPTGNRTRNPVPTLNKYNICALGEKRALLRTVRTRK